MPVKMVNTLLIRSTGGRLAHIVQQSCPAEGFVLLYAGQGLQNVFTHVPAVMGIVLGRLHAGVEFRQNHRRNARLPDHAEYLRVIRGQKLHQLHLNPLGADLSQSRCKFRQGRFCLRLNLKIQLGRKTDCPQDSQGVLGKPLSRVAHTADLSALQVADTAEGIYQTLFFIICHGIDGKVPPLQIFQKIWREQHLLRVAAVQIFAVNPVGGDLEAFFSVQDRHGSVLEPRVHRSGK